MQACRKLTIILDPQSPTTIYAFFSNGLYRSGDSGTRWQQAYLPASNSPTGQATPSAFAIAASQPQTIYAVTRLGLPLKSVDAGATSLTIGPVNPSNANSFAIDPQNPDVSWFADSAGIERSVDGALNTSAAIAARNRPTVYLNGAVVQPAFFGAASGESSGVYQLSLVVPPLPSGALNDSIGIESNGNSGFTGNGAALIPLYAK